MGRWVILRRLLGGRLRLIESHDSEAALWAAFNFWANAEGTVIVRDRWANPTLRFF